MRKRVRRQDRLWRGQQIEWIEARFERFPERREYGIVLLLPRQELARLVHQKAGEALNFDPLFPQPRLDLCVYRDAVSIIAPVPVDCPCAGLFDKAFQHLLRIAREQDQSVACIPERLIQCHKGMMQPPCLRATQSARKGHTMFSDKDANHRLLTFDRGMECKIVPKAKIPPEPHDCG